MVYVRKQSQRVAYVEFALYLAVEDTVLLKKSSWADMSMKCWANVDN